MATYTTRLELLQDEMFKTLLTKEDFDNRLDLLLAETEPDRRPSLIRDLAALFQILELPCETGRDNDYYLDLVEHSDLPDNEQMTERMMDALYEHFEEFPTPADYMLRIVERLESPEDHWRRYPLKLRILKQFVKYGECTTYQQPVIRNGVPVLDENGEPKMETAAIYAGNGQLRKYFKEHYGRAPRNFADLANGLRTDVFKKLEEANAERAAREKADRKARIKKKDYSHITDKVALLQAAEDLAEGRFKANGGTKKLLYLFAMVYSMTYYTGNGAEAGERGEMVQYERDFVRNLFTDYYSNNLMRFITDAYRKNPTAYEHDPSGQGINYKNFAEAIYTYYIAQDMKPAEKIRRSREMIERCKDCPPPADLEYKNTQIMRQLFSFECLSMPEAEFEQYIRDNYDCKITLKIPKEDGSVNIQTLSPIQVQNTQHTVFQRYRELIDQIEAYGCDPYACNFGLWFTDVPATEKEGLDNPFLHYPDPERGRRLQELLLAINSYLGRNFREWESNCSFYRERKDVSRTPARLMDITSPAEISRTALITAFYYMYHARFMEGLESHTMAEIYKDFTSELDPILLEVGYQPLSSKNVFDAVVLYSAYHVVHN